MYICNFFLYIIKWLPGKYMNWLKEFTALTKKDMTRFFFFNLLYNYNRVFTTKYILALDKKIK